MVHTWLCRNLSIWAKLLCLCIDHSLFDGLATPTDANRVPNRPKSTRNLIPSTPLPQKHTPNLLGTFSCLPPKNMQRITSEKPSSPHVSKTTRKLPPTRGLRNTPHLLRRAVREVPRAPGDAVLQLQRRRELRQRHAARLHGVVADGGLGVERACVWG